MKKKRRRGMAAKGTKRAPGKPNLTPEQAELSKAQRKTDRAPMTVGGHESLRGFKQPRRKWDTTPRVTQCPCEGSGSYVLNGVLRQCRCGGR